MAEQLTPITPGSILREEFLKPLGLSQNQLARELNIPVSRLNDIVKGKRAITSDTALRLARFFGTSAEFWLNLQQRYDLKIAKQNLLAEIEQTVNPIGSI